MSKKEITTNVKEDFGQLLDEIDFPFSKPQNPSLRLVRVIKDDGKRYIAEIEIAQHDYDDIESVDPEPTNHRWVKFRVDITHLGARRRRRSLAEDF